VAPPHLHAPEPIGAPDIKSASVLTPLSNVAPSSPSIHAQRAAARARVAVAARVASLSDRRGTEENMLDASAPVRAPHNRLRPPSNPDRPPSGSTSDAVPKTTKKRKKRARSGIDPRIVIVLIMGGLGAIFILATVIVIVLWPYLVGGKSAGLRPAVVSEVADNDDRDVTDDSSSGAKAELASGDKGTVDAARDEGEPTKGDRPDVVVIVTSNPTGAKVRVDGNLKGTTPLTLPQSTPTGKLQVLVEADGFEPEQSVVEFDGTRELHVELVRVAAKPVPNKPSASNRPSGETAKKAASASVTPAKKPASGAQKPSTGNKPPAKKATFGKW
jgi:hypothetical protein